MRGERVLLLRCAASCCRYAVTEFIARRKERTLITRSYFYCVAYTTRAVTPRKGTSIMQQTMRQEMKRDAVTVIQLHSYTVIVTIQSATKRRRLRLNLQLRLRLAVTLAERKRPEDKASLSDMRFSIIQRF